MIHCLIRREVREGKESEFTDAIRSFFSDTICDPNTTGAELVAPVDPSKSRTYGILRSFPDKAARDAFYASDAYKAWSDQIEEFVEGEAVSKELHGLEAFFIGGGQEGPPPTWKMAIVTWLGVNLVTTPLLLLLMPLIVGTYGLKFPFDNFVFNVFVVSLLSWLVMPAMVKLFGRWLHDSNPEPSPIAELNMSTLPGFLGFLFAPNSGEAARDRAIAAFALFIGVTMAMLHGWAKLVGAYHYFANSTPWLDVDLVVALGLPFPAVMATVAGSIQFFCSLAVGVGFLTRLNAILVASTLIVALYWNAIQGKDNQVALLYLVGFVFLAFVNGGKMSLDDLIFRHRTAT